MADPTLLLRLQPTPYQIEFTSASSGKLIQTSKKRIRWTFGFANMKAIRCGHFGVDCRGEEHEIILTWSLNSGKRILEFDGKVVHKSYSTGEEFQYTCDIKAAGSLHVVEIKAHCGYVVDEFIDLRIDGQRFDDMLRLFELNKEKVCLNAISDSVDYQRTEENPAVQHGYCPWSVVHW